MTIAELLKEARKKIGALDAELLLAKVLKKSREFLITNLDKKITNSQFSVFNKLIRQRAKGVPVAYLVGHKEFYGLDFIVNKHVLVPRPETELIVECVLDKLRIRNYELGIMNATLIDVGTGSGCIAISIAKSIQTLIVVATDTSKKALKVAKKNALLHDTKIKFLHGNLLEPILNSSFINHNSSFIITANLPYLTEEQYKSEPSIQHEPKQALVADKDGLAHYEQLLKQIRQLVRNYELGVMSYLEIDPRQTAPERSDGGLASQSERITTLIKKYLPSAGIEIKKDLAGQDRMVSVEI
jgi:release factor glutamine methyltransferase